MADTMDSREVSTQAEVEATSEREIDINDIASGVKQWADSGVKFGDIMRATGKEFFVNRPKAKVEERADAMREAAQQRVEARQARAAERQEAAAQRKAARTERIQGFRDRIRASISRAADNLTAGPRAAYSAAASMLNVPVAATMRLTGSMSEKAHSGMDVLRNFSNSVSQKAQSFGKGVSETVGVARERGMLAGAGYGLSRAGMGIARGAVNVGTSLAGKLGQGYAAFKENHAEEIADFKRSLNEIRSDVVTRKDMFVSDHITGYAKFQKGRSAVDNLFARATGFIGRKFSALSNQFGLDAESAEQAVEVHATQRGTFMNTNDRLDKLSDSEFAAFANIVNGEDQPDVIVRARESGKSVFAVGSVGVSKALDELVESDGARHGEFEAAVEGVARARYGDDKVDLMVKTAAEFGHEGVSVAEAVRLCESDKAVSSVYAAEAHDLDEAMAEASVSEDEVLFEEEQGDFGDDAVVFESQESVDEVPGHYETVASEADRQWVESAAPVDEDEVIPVTYAEDFEAEMFDDEREAPVFQSGGVEADADEASYNPYDE